MLQSLAHASAGVLHERMCLARTNDVEHVLVDYEVKEDAHQVEHDEKVCFVPHAYSKVKNIPPGTYSRDAMRSQCDQSVLKLLRGGHSIKTSSLRQIGSHIPNGEVTRRPYG